LYTCYGKSKIGAGTIIANNVILGYPSRDELSKVGSFDETKLEGISGATIGENCVLRDFGIIYSNTTLGNNVQTGHHYMVREESTVGNGSLIGSNVIIENQCKIGNNVSIQSGVYIPTYSKIADNVFLGPYVVLTNDKYIGYKDPRKRGLEGVVIDEKVAVGANSTILPGVHIGRNVVIGSGAVVTKDVEPGCVVAGIPARVIDKQDIID
jgi:acetyltransferase-like isoleucine patch superfamily enzyme